MLNVRPHICLIKIAPNTLTNKSKSMFVSNRLSQCLNVFFYSNYYPSSKIYAIIGFFFPFRSTAAYFQASMWQSDSCKDSQQWDHGTLFCPTSPFCSLSSAPPYRRTSHSGTDGLCLCKLKRVLCCAAHACVCVCVGVCVCFCVSTSACLCQASAERPGNQRKNRTGHYLNNLQQNLWRVFLKHDSISVTVLEWKY